MQNRLFRAFLKLLPEEFRAGYAREMEATFQAERRDVRLSGRRAATRLWLATIGDVLRMAPSEHFDILRRDLRFAARTMAARPLHTVTAATTLALGIGANLAMFAVVDAVLLTPLPYRDPSALVAIHETESGGDASNMGYLTFVDLRERSRGLEAVVAVASSTATLSGGGVEAERVNAMRVSRAYFDMLGDPPVIGRTFTETEDRPGAARRVVILSDSLWRRRFNADPAVVGRPISINGTDYRVVGVMPADFDDLVSARMYDGAELWYPLGYDPAASFACRTCRHLRVFGRLSAGTDPEIAERELGQIFATLEGDHPTEYHEAGAVVTRFSDVFLGPVRPVLLVLWAGVAALLLVACGNVANLLLFRASERSREISLRAALGVTRGRLARQLLTESALLGFAGGLAGLVLAWVAVVVLATIGPAQIPRMAEATVDGRVAGVALALTLLSSILFGLAPLRHLLRRDPSGRLQGAGRQTESRVVWRVRAGLVAVNVAMAALLLVGSGLLLRSAAGLLAVAPGFDPSDVMTMKIWATGERFRQGETAEQIDTAVRFYDDVLSQARALPGVTAAAAVTTLPLGGGVDGYGFHVEGRPSANPAAAPSADRFVVTPGYFAALRIPLIGGRLLDDRDRRGLASVVVINQTAADELFPGEDPLGHRISLGPPNAEPRTIVGIVDDVRHHGLDVGVGYQVYVPQAQWVWAETFMTLVIRSRLDAAAVSRPMREIVRVIDPAQPVTDMRLYDQIVSATTGTRRFAAGLLTCFALTALLMAVIGLYGALGVLVGQRRREIGLRLALGARAETIQRMVLAQGLRPVVIGLLIGLGLAAISVRALQSMLYGVEAFDPVSFVGAGAVLAACAVSACLLPAWRAARIDPAATLRAD